MVHDVIVCLSDAVEPALSTEATIGLAVGVALGAIVLIILVIVFVSCLCCAVSKLGE